MALESAIVWELSQQYHESNDEGRELLSEELYAHHYNGPRTSPDALANALRALLHFLDLLLKTAAAETMYIVVIRNSALECNASPFHTVRNR